MNPRARLYLLIAIPGFLTVISSMLLSLDSPYVTWAAASVLALMDKTLGGWTFVHPAVSWAFVSFVVVATVHFAIFETHKVGQRDIRLTYLIFGALFLLLGPLMWGMIQTLQTG